MADGSYYEGHFAYDQRNGFGFSISVDHLHAGTWKNDRFVGERMTYNTDRIYGIDISRYQHEQGRKRFAINWGKMNITSLGKRNTLPDDAKPAVSFVYIKATEGLTIRNRYFMSDYQAARKQKLPVGAYHFFSTKQSGRLQANYFLKSGRFLIGDLPPVLDVEPTDARIMQMGGPEALFREIRSWIAVVEQQLHVKPILYVSQNFVHKYFDLAPDLKENYHVWIARYGEYRPDVHLAIWQLSADGHVNGIHGPVDINVFNGYAGQWQEFLNNETIQHRN
jgi:lysozyme